MQVNGIIAEYNPFHNSHKYHLGEARSATGADYTIIALGGNFMQRGAPAILNKYARAEMALRNGADLVLEIPAFYAAGSAEYFATGAVSMLDKLGVVDTLCFGSECGQERLLEQIAAILVEEPESYKARLRIKLRQGYTFPAARNWALLEFCPALSEAVDVLGSPNNILGIEYIKCILRRNSSMKPYTTKRVGSNYHDKRMGERQSSALAIRQAIFSRQDICFLKGQIPDSAYEIFASVMKHTRPIHPNDFSLPLHYKLLSDAEYGYDRYIDISPALSDRIRNNLYNYTSFRGFSDLLKSKDMTHSRISRCLMHILLNMDTGTLESYREMDYVPYARVLGFRQDAAPLLTAIKEKTSIPLVTKLADAGKILSEPALSMLKNDIAISNIYNSIAASKSKQPMQNEYSTPIVIV